MMIRKSKKQLLLPAGLRAPQSYIHLDSRHSPPRHALLALRVRPLQAPEYAFKENIKIEMSGKSLGLAIAAEED